MVKPTATAHSHIEALPDRYLGFRDQRRDLAGSLLQSFRKLSEDDGVSMPAVEDFDRVGLFCADSFAFGAPNVASASGYPCYAYYKKPGYTSETDKITGTLEFYAIGSLISTQDSIAMGQVAGVPLGSKITVNFPDLRTPDEWGQDEPQPFLTEEAKEALRKVMERGRQEVFPGIISYLVKHDCMRNSEFKGIPFTGNELGKQILGAPAAANFSNTTFVQCVFRGLDLTGIDITNTKFDNCIFENCIGVDMKGKESATLTNCKVTYTRAAMGRKKEHPAFDLADIHLGTLNPNSDNCDCKHLDLCGKEKDVPLVLKSGSPISAYLVANLDNPKAIAAKFAGSIYRPDTVFHADEAVNKEIHAVLEKISRPIKNMGTRLGVNARMIGTDSDSFLNLLAESPLIQTARITLTGTDTEKGLEGGDYLVVRAHQDEILPERFGYPVKAPRLFLIRKTGKQNTFKVHRLAYDPETETYDIEPVGDYSSDGIKGLLKGEAAQPSVEPDAGSTGDRSPADAADPATDDAPEDIAGPPVTTR